MKQKNIYILIAYLIFTIVWFLFFDLVLPSVIDLNPNFSTSKLHLWLFLALNAVIMLYLFYYKKNTSFKANDDNDNFIRLINNLKDDCFYFRHEIGKPFAFISSSINNVLGVNEEEFCLNYQKYNADSIYNNSLVRHKKQTDSGLSLPVYDTFLYNSQGSILNFQIREFPILDQYNEVIAVEGIAHNITEFKKVEAELKEKDNKYQILFESANDAIFIMKNGLFIDCNKRATEMFECGYDQIIMQSPLKFSPANQSDGTNSSESASEKIKKALNGESLVFQWTHQRLTGEKFEAEVSLNKFKFIDQNFLQAIVRDVNEKVKYQNILKESESKFRTVAESTVSAIFIVQKENFVYMNNAGLDICDYSWDELSKVRFFDIIHPDFREMVKERGLARQRGEDIENHYEFKIVSGKNTEKWLDFTASYILYNNAPALLGTAYDISSKKTIEIELEKSKKILLSAINVLPDMLSVIDKNHFVVLSNWKDHEYISLESRKKICYSCFFNRTEPCEVCHTDEVFKNGKEYSYERVNPIDGILRRITILPILNENNEVEMVVEYIKNLEKTKN
ncbi:MAG: hypothetical protein A2033_11980 [Bacteroidetes bacterium GWA2_31_9]|nr:MAG: hypothetical protein A2033_11980 [Bacteroidetes bacterium GWA2_31_9]